MPLLVSHYFSNFTAVRVRFILPKPVRNVIVDTPTDKDLFRGKGHERTALSLATAIRKFDNDDRAIGLDGPWGSGKSSIVEIAARHLKEADGKDQITHHFFTFDIWKSQGTGFRRSFLEHFVAWAREKFPHEEKILKTINEDIRGKKREISTSNQPVLGWFGIIFLFILPLLPIYYFWAKAVFDRLASSKDTTIWNYLDSWPAWLFYAFALGVGATTIKRMYFDKRGNVDLNTALSSVLLISSKQHQDHKSVQRIREVDPNDYEFHATLRSILSTIQNKRSRVVVVLDNIDRLPQSEIQEYWALSRSIFSGPHHSSKVKDTETITAIIPYDRTLIEIALGLNDGKKEERQSSLTRKSSRELFSKTFDEVLAVAPPVMSNTREFFAEKLTTALPDQLTSDEVYRTYRIFMEVLREEGGLTTPRQAVAFVNDVTGIFALHDGLFSLPTIAAYLAHQDLITENPGSLNDPQFLDSKVVSLAADPSLAKNLAAIVFNVDPELAFEVLLDNDLAAAIVAVRHDDLVKLSSSAGFDLRAEDVIQDNSEQWRSTGDFGQAIKNFAQVLPHYHGAAKPRIIDALLDGFKKLREISISGKAYEDFLPLFQIAGETARPALMDAYLQRGFAGSTKETNDGFDAGRELAAFLGDSLRYVDALGLGIDFKRALASCSPSKSPDFLYGLAIDIAENNLGFEDIGSTTIALPEGDDLGNRYLVPAVRNDPSSALVAFTQFDKKKLIISQHWIDIATACVEECSNADHSTVEVGDLLELICRARARLGEKRSEASIVTALQNGHFFRNLKSDKGEASQRAISLAFFLLGDEDALKQLAVPTRLQAQQRVQDQSDEFNAFNELIAGTADLTDEQASLIADKAKDARRLSRIWTKFGQQNPSHLGVRRVNERAYLSGQSPSISIATLNTYFNYLQSLLGEEGLRLVLQRIEGNISDESAAGIELGNLTDGLLLASHYSENGKWGLFHDAIEKGLRDVEESEWKDSLANYNHLAQVLFEKISSSGSSLESRHFREPMTQVMLEVLAGTVQPSAPDGAFDVLMGAMHVSYHADILRTLREKIRDVNSTSLGVAAQLFPTTLHRLITDGDRVSSEEKDNLVRYILCPALEENIRPVLQAFVDLGNRKVSELRKGAKDSTEELIVGALGAFSRSSGDRAWTAQVTEVVQGRRRAKNLLELWFGVREDEE